MKELAVAPDILIKQAMKKLDETAEKCLLVVDKENHLLGTLTDGDLRRAVLNSLPFSSSIAGVYNSNPTVVSSDLRDMDEIKKIFIKHKLDLIPIINSKRNLVGYMTWEKVFGNGNLSNKSVLQVPVVIMAGGQGTRLEPFTKVLPKPLIPINDKPIIEHIIQHFTDAGCDEFHITVNYKAKILKAYFEELSPSYSVDFVNESEPLGTAGSLKLLEGKIDEPFVVTNCDIIIKTNYKELYDFHIDNKFDLTLVASTKEYIIPYGTCELTDQGYLHRINEKPRYEFLVNTGLYIVNPALIGLIPDNELFHITHLIEKIKSLGKKVGVFPVNENAWIDIGQWAEYQKAVELL
jgi:dTDP-glucose pyrophosphorylase